MHILSFQINLILQYAFAGGFKSTFLDNLLPCRKVVLMSIDQSSVLLEEIIGMIPLTTSQVYPYHMSMSLYEPHGDNLFQTLLQTPSFRLIPSGLSFREQTQRTDRPFFVFVW